MSEVWIKWKDVNICLQMTQPHFYTILINE